MRQVAHATRTAIHQITWCALIMIAVIVVLLTIGTETPVFAALGSATGHSDGEPAIVIYMPWLTTVLAIVALAGITCGGLRRES
jgi:hypothetical protein